MGHVYRCYAEKRTGFDVEAGKVLKELKEQLGIDALEGLRIICRYDVDQVEKAVYEMAKTTVFSEPMVDDFYEEKLPNIQGAHSLLIVEALPGQFDQRAGFLWHSASSCWLAVTGRWFMRLRCMCL